MNEFLLILQGALGLGIMWVTGKFKLWFNSKVQDIKIQGFATLLVSSVLAIGSSFGLNALGLIHFPDAPAWVTWLTALGVTELTAIGSWELLKKWLMARWQKTVTA